MLDEENILETESCGFFFFFFKLLETIAEELTG